MSKFSIAFEKWWKTRTTDIQKGSKVDPITIRGVFYLLRKNVGPRAMPKKGGFYSALERLETSTKIPREDLRIITEPKVSVISSEGERPLMKADFSKLENALAFLYIEKSTIIEALELDHSLTDRGIIIIKGMGFSVKEVNKLLKRAQDSGIPILTLSDMDPAGILIDETLKKSGVKTVRLGIDLQLVEDLNLDVKDVREILPRAKKNSHLKYLAKNFPLIAKEFYQIGEHGNPGRIEIDSVMSLAGKDRFIEEILKRADIAVPVKKVKKALHYKRVPTKVDALRNQVHDLVDDLFTKAAESAEDKYKDSKDSFNKIKLSEVENSIQQAIDGKAEAPATQVLEETIKALQKVLEAQKKKENVQV